jgi:hypothetical protein
MYSCGLNGEVQLEEAANLNEPQQHPLTLTIVSRLPRHHDGVLNNDPWLKEQLANGGDLHVRWYWFRYRLASEAWVSLGLTLERFVALAGRDGCKSADVNTVETTDQVNVCYSEVCAHVNSNKAAGRKYN